MIIPLLPKYTSVGYMLPGGRFMGDWQKKDVSFNMKSNMIVLR